MTKAAEKTMGSTKPFLWLVVGCWAVVLLAGMALPQIVGTYQLQLSVQAATLGTFALSIAWLVNQTGMLSFGHAAYYGIAGYSVAILTTETELPVLGVIIAAVLISAAAAFLVGLVIAKSPGVAFAMLSLSIGMLVWVATTKLDSVTHGTDGFNIVFEGSLLGKDAQSFISPVTSWPVIWSVLMLVMALFWLVNRSVFGRRLVAVRENEERMRFSGYRTYLPRVFAFVLSAAVAGLAGSMSVLTTSYISPDNLSFHVSGLALSVAILGGIGSIVGPSVGALIFVLLQAYLSGSSNYEFILGGALMIVIIAAPGGLAEIVKKATSLMTRRKRAAHV